MQTNYHYSKRNSSGLHIVALGWFCCSVRDRDEGQLALLNLQRELNKFGREYFYTTDKQFSNISRDIENFLQAPIFRHNSLSNGVITTSFDLSQARKLILRKY